VRVLQGRRDDVLLLSGGGEEGAASSSRALDAWWKKERERYRQRIISDCAKRNATRGEGGADGLEVTGCKGFLGSGGGGEVVVVMMAQEVLMPRGLKMVL